MSATVDRGLVVRWLPRGVLAASPALTAAAATGAIDLPDQKDKLAEIGRQHRNGARPLLREVVVTPSQTLLIHEMSNDIGRLVAVPRFHVRQVV